MELLAGAADELVEVGAVGTLDALLELGVDVEGHLGVGVADLAHDPQAIMDGLVAHAPPADDATLIAALLHTLHAPPAGSIGDRLDAAITTLLERHAVDTQTMLGEDVAAALLRLARHRLSTQ